MLGCVFSRGPRLNTWPFLSFCPSVLLYLCPSVRIRKTSRNLIQEVWRCENGPPTPASTFVHFFNGCLVYGIQKKRIRNKETAHKILQRSESWLRKNELKRTKICGLAKNAKFCYILVDFSVTITQIFARFGALFLYFEYASFEYHKPNIR